jgi:aspartyl-tRNA(Asn)/glutamyl-tRNA(Gln) amidotransferase subunit A
MIAFASSLDQGGPMARSAADLAVLFAALCGADPKDSTSAERPEEDWINRLRGPTPLAALASTGRKLRIGLPAEYFRDLATDGAQALAEMRRRFESAGHEFVDLSLPHTEAAIPVYYVIAGAEASTNLSRYDGVRFGHRCDNPQSLEDLYERSRSEGFGAEVKRRILTGTYALSVGYYDAYYLKAQKIRRLIQRDFLQAFDSVDLLLTPTAPGPAFPRAALSQDPVAMYQQDVFTVPASLAGLPALSLPCGFAGGLPLGAQLIAPHFDELTLLQAAHFYQQHSDFHQQHPELG